MVAHLVGTPSHFPSVDGGILFLEDIGEHPYRIERMLYQLHFAGILRRQQALVLGVFNGYDPLQNDNGYDFATMVAHARERFGIPILTGLRSGIAPTSSRCRWAGMRAGCPRPGAATLVLSNYG